jgi:hypothetical protein
MNHIAPTSGKDMRKLEEFLEYHHVENRQKKKQAKKRAMHTWYRRGRLTWQGEGNERRIKFAAVCGGRKRKSRGHVGLAKTQPQYFTIGSALPFCHQNAKTRPLPLPLVNKSE